MAQEREKGIRMAIVEYDYPELCRFIGKQVPQKELRENLDMMGAPVESFEGEAIRCDITPNRIDLLSVEGMGRALANFMGIRGPFDYEVTKSGISMKVEPSVKGVRPFAVAGIVKGVSIDDATIRSLMQVQEKIHGTFGRDRKKVAIGIHNLDPLKPPFTYKAVHPNEISFIPLDTDESMNLKQILERHPKGKGYAHLVNTKPKYPIIVDSSNNVLSFPPIINGELTRVSESTKNIFIDITGTSPGALNDALNVICALFADRGGKLYSVDVNGTEFPNMKRRRLNVSAKKINKLIGFNPKPAELAKLLSRMGHIASGTSTVEVLVPPYRSDVMHWVDIAEDAAIAYGYNKLEPTLPQLPTIGKLIERDEEPLRETLLGLGFCEAITFTLSNQKVNYAGMRLDDDNEATVISNPLTADFTLFRTWLAPSLLLVLGGNSHEPMPQRIFEIGACSRNGRMQRHLSCATVKSKATFSEMKSVAEALAFEAGWKCSFKEEGHPSFIPGRCMSVYFGSERKGIFGEIHPEVLNNFGIEEPVVLLEVEL